MKNSITNRQLFFIIFMTLTTYTIIDISKIMANSAGRSSWIPIMITSLFFGIGLVIISKLNNMFQGKVFFDYSQEIVGKFFKYIIGTYYALYFLVISIYLITKLVGLISSDFLPKTPQFILVLSSIMLFAFVANKGISNIARLFEIYGIPVLAITFLICILNISEGNKNYILPFFNYSEIKEFPKAIKNLIIAYGGIEILLITPFNINNKNFSKIAFITLLIIGFFYVLVVESTFMILGINNSMHLNGSYIEALRLTYIPVIERVDILYLTFGLANLFCGMSFVYIAIVEYSCKLIPHVKRLSLILLTSIILFILCLIALNIKEFDKIYERYLFYLVLISSLFIPITVFIIAKIKKKS